MKYNKLSYLFHQDEQEWNELYQILYSFPLTRHFEKIEIKQIKARIGFPAFFYYTEAIATLLSDITDELVQLTMILNKLPPIAASQFTHSCLVDEIKASNDIEGVRSTRKEINYAIEEQTDENKAINVRFGGIVNKYLKLQNKENIPFQTSKDLRAFYNDFILDEVLQEDPKNYPDGKLFRKEIVEVHSRTKVIHQGLYPESKIIEYMDEALKILHNQEIPGLVRISIFHYLFGYIHPFYDGNGRTSRFITSYYLSRMINPLVAVRLSLTIKKSLRIYYRLFEETNSYANRGDLTPFITGFLWLILRSISRVNELLKDKSEKLTELLEKLKTLPLENELDQKIYYILLQAALFSDDGATLKEIANTTQRSPRTIQLHIKTYPQSHISINKSRRAHRFKLNLEILK